MSSVHRTDNLTEAFQNLARIFTDANGSPNNPSDSTHRYYICSLSINSRDVMYCRRAPKGAYSFSTQHHLVSVNRACPELFDQLVLSSKLKKPVALE